MNTMYLGIDQTGAVDGKKNPKPLPTCLLQDGQTQLFYLSSFNFASLKHSAMAIDAGNLEICIDCVIGLPQQIQVAWREAVARTREVEGYGRSAAAEYFRNLGKGLRPPREVELKCRANSVFKELPFQKNIQTGTFRFWKDMANDPDWFYAPMIPNEPGSGRIPVYEGYPSLSWKLLFGVKTRQPAELGRLLEQMYPDVYWNSELQEAVHKDPNFADAFVLALTAKVLIDKPLPLANPEGWILGADKVQ